MTDITISQRAETDPAGVVTMFRPTRRRILLAVGKVLTLPIFIHLTASTCQAQLFRYRPPESQRQGYHGVAASLPVTNLRQEKAESQIMTALEKIVSLNIDKMPLEDFAARFASEAGVAVQIDYKSLEEMTVPVSSPVSVRLSNVTLRRAIEEALREHSLNWIIVDSDLLITTNDIAMDAISARVYPVRDLVTFGPAVPPDYDTLIEVIVNTIKPDSWVDTGGPGTIERFPKAYALVITQTRDVHEQIGYLLSQLRKVQAIHDGGVTQRGYSHSTTDELPANPDVSPVRTYVPTAGSRLVRVHP